MDGDPQWQAVVLGLSMVSNPMGEGYMGWLWDVMTGTPRWRGRNCQEWAEQIGAPSVNREEICEAFRAMGAPALPALIGLFTARKGDDRQTANVLAALGAEVLPPVVDAFLHHLDTFTREGCGKTLQQIGA